MAQKKVNSKKIIIDDIEFQSTLEGFCYKELKSSGLNFEYEPCSYVLLNKFKSKNLVKLLKLGDLDIKKKKYPNEAIRDIVYTPDFVLDYDDKIIIIETKGRANERYPIIRKLFFNLLSNDLSHRYYFFEPHNRKEVVTCINLIKSIIMINLDAIRMSMSLIDGAIRSKDFKLLESFISNRKFEEAIELISSIIKIIAKQKEKSDGDSMAIVNLSRLMSEIKEYYSQIVGESEEEWI